MSNNKYLVVLSVIIVFSILAISLTLASNEHSNNHSKDNKKNQTSNETNHTENETQKENKTMNYGRCVSNFTKIKNNCFKLVKKDHKECRILAKNSTTTDQNGTIIPSNKTDIKNKITLCRDSYKNNLESCKLEFKQFKDTCNQYKCKKNQVFINNTCVKTQ